MLGMLHLGCRHKHGGSSTSVEPGYAGCYEQLLATEVSVRLCATLTGAERELSVGLVDRTAE